MTLTVLCFVFLGFFDHQSFIGKTVEDITAHSARCQRGSVEELVYKYTSVCETRDDLHQ